MSIVTEINASDGTDIGTKFAAYVSGTKPAATGWFSSAGSDPKDLFQPLVGSPTVSPTGVLNGSGVDFASLFTSGSVVVNPGYVTAGAIASIAHGAGNTTATVTCTWFSNGTYSETLLGGGGHTGNWYSPTTTGIGSGFNLKLTFTLGAHSGGSVVTTNPATAFTSLSSNLTFTTAFTAGGGGITTFTASGTLQAEIQASSGGADLSNQTFSTSAEVDVV